MEKQIIYFDTSVKHQTLCYFLILLFSFSITIAQVKAQSNRKVPKQTRILFLLDASGSMLAKWEKDLRINIAKKLLSDIVDSLKQRENLQLALRVYGHQYDKKVKNCKDTKLEVPFLPENHEQIKKNLKLIKPKGVTPIAYSIEQSANDFPKGKNTRNVIILITDGLESCRGDPCAVSLALQRKGIILKPFIIGIGINKDFAKSFDCMGAYFDASDVKNFKGILNKIIQRTLSETTVSVELLDIYNKPTETNVNLTFINNFTGLPVYNFIHFLDKNGKPDIVDIDAVLDYDLIVNTIPKVIKKNIKLEPGINNIIKIKTPQGSLIIKQDGYKKYGTVLNAIITSRATTLLDKRESGGTTILSNIKHETLNIQKIGTTHKYLVGKYDLEILTLPRTYYYDVEIKQSETTKITIRPPGVLSISESINGYGSIYVIDKAGNQQWIYNLENENSKTNLAMQQGNYKIVFRAKGSFSSSSTYMEHFRIISGLTTTVRLFSK